MSKVLLVDDNPLVLGVLEQAVAPLADISATRTAVDALAKAANDPPDLIITDFQMPGMDGCQLLSSLRAIPATARVPVMMLASRADISERLKSVQESVDFIEKPFFISDARAQVKRVLDRIALEKMAREASGSTVLRGSLAQMGVIDLLQSLEMGRKTCRLTLTHAGTRCDMYFAEGQLTHAVCGNETGDQAVYQSLAWGDPGGSFQIDFSASSTERTTTRTTQGLLMEGLRLLDEANRDGEE